MNMLIENQIVLLNIAEADLTESNRLLEAFKKEWDKVPEHPLDDVEIIRTMQLVLQYRLDTQGALYQLAKLQQYLLQLLGIEAKHSAEFNIERLAYALGSEDLHQILNLLNNLVDALLRIITHYQHQQALDRKKTQERLKKTKFVEAMVQVIEKQKSFTTSINQLKLALEDIGGAPQAGVLYNHIAALEGPISRFELALQHGLILSGGFYQQLQKKSNLEFMLADTIQKANQALHSMNYHPEQQRLFTPVKEPEQSDRLEERAATRRLSNFFHH